jgi:hypothetical protein
MNVVRGMLWASRIAGLGAPILGLFPSEDVARLSAYMTEHLQRFGDYTLKLRPVVPLPNQKDALPEALSENREDSEEMSA